MRPDVAIIGAGPAGLIAAERLAGAGHSVAVFDRMRQPGRKFLLAGRGGLNITHGEALARLLGRYEGGGRQLLRAVEAFPPEALRAWCEGLGQAVFVGSSGRVFPVAFKAAPLLRAWLARLEGLGVVLRLGHRWMGWTEGGCLRFEAGGQETAVRPRAVLLALGGGSWPRMGSDGGWVDILRRDGAAVRSLEPSNVGVCIDWPVAFRERFAGVPLKRIALTCGGRRARGEAVVTAQGLEGGCVYALSSAIRAGLAADGAVLLADLRPDLDAEMLAARLAAPRRGRSLSNFLRVEAGLAPVAIGLVQRVLHGKAGDDLATAIKACPLEVSGLQPLERAISSAGGLAWAGLDEGFMLRRRPGVFAAGEMLDWEAPTGGYLLQACFSTGVAAAMGIEDWLVSRFRSSSH